MKQTSKKISDPAAPRQQNRWDWRAATNFITGGAGGGLLLGVSLVALEPLGARAALLLGLALIGCGLLCVWFEIGRPWRALNVYRHIASSWMTREAVAAALLFASGGLALWTLHPLPVMLTSILGLAFVYCQARMLGANKGIPAWRQPRSIPLMLFTGLAEGAGFLACIGAISNPAGGFWPLAVLLVLVLLRALLWKRFLAALRTGGAPDGSLQVLNRMDARFMVFGHALPLLAVLGALAGIPGRAGWTVLAGSLVIACGWWFKFTLVRRAAFTQGLALLHLPMYQHGATDYAFRPGWKVAPGPGA
jgi:phenylacetyl-CoA:acceptor oxidoreductase 26-kDa subunit